MNWTPHSDTTKQLQVSIMLTNPLRNWLTYYRQAAEKGTRVINGR